ncbi:MAG: TIGR04076 family protein [Candidatus Thorarchaeota archaeon]|nr:TIGR04076 family protein [Candidatus Thorarchaeota archaeon]
MSQNGTCAMGYRVGDEFTITESGIDGKVCISALYSLLPKAFAMMFNARFPWLDDQCSVTHACPDANNPVVFELHRVEVS